MPYDEDFDEDEDENYSDDDETVTFVCEDCDYRWKATVDAEDPEHGSESMICPMCGSANVSDF